MPKPGLTWEIRRWGRPGKLSGDVYVDGSASRPADKEGRRAGFALVQMQGELPLRMVWGSLPLSEGPHQTAPEAEDFAICALSEFGTGRIRVHGDCANSIRMLNEG
eukprot:6424519-Amphidinium_carterae.1